ncbi:MAG: methylated-DNA--[protein]-cysteine S-methyltransferase [Magnetococcus sp. DMHC-8]
MKRLVGVGTGVQEWDNTTPASALAGMPAALQPLLSPTFAAIRTHQGAVTALLWERPPTPLPPVDPDLLRQVRAWLADYFAGLLRPVSFPLVWAGTVFQQRLARQLAAIPPGQTVCYGELARQLQSAPRAVGRGVGANPLPLLLPCHRVVATTGWGGFSAPGGVETKRWPLAWEQRWTS